VEPEVDVERQGLWRAGAGPAGGVSTRAGPGRAAALIDLRDHPDEAAAAPVELAGALDPLVKALMRAVSLSDVAAAVVAYGTAAADARWARVVLLDRTGAVAVSLLGGQAVRSSRLDSVGFAVRCPWTDAVREGITLEFASTADVRRAYPKMEETYALPGEGAVITLPLAPAGPCCGAVTFGFDDRGTIPDPVRATVAQVASLTAYAAQRSAVYDDEYHAAEMLQQAYLPDRLPDVSGLTFASRCLSASEPFGVAGDWYDVLRLPGPLVGLVMGDVAGHGIPAATTMAALRGAVRAFSTVETSPAAILTRMNTYMGVFKPDAFATLFVAVFDPADGKLCFARAGHPPALVVHSDGASDLLVEPLGPPLGLPGVRYDEGEEPFPSGSTLVIYTDGLIERQDQSIDASMADLVRTASSHRAGRPEHLCDRLVELLVGAELCDDVTLLVATRDGGAGAGPAGG
jgi:serine phosphatase RsbU (regulator of sigma subunit)